MTELNHTESLANYDGCMRYWSDHVLSLGLFIQHSYMVIVQLILFGEERGGFYWTPAVPDGSCGFPDLHYVHFCLDSLGCFL